MYLNKALVIGNLTRDPEMRSLPTGVQVTSFSLATNRVWTDKNGAKQENTDYHNIVVFGKQAENVGKYLKKGSSALVEGRMQTRSWDTPDGTKKYKTEIVADRVQFGPRRDGVAGASGKGGKSGDKDNAGIAETIDTIEYPSEEINSEDIPF